MASFVVGKPTTTIPAAATSRSNVGPPAPLVDATGTTTANGRCAITAAASARCSASPLPVATTNEYSTRRPQVSNPAWSKTVDASRTASANVPVCRVAWFTGRTWGNPKAPSWPSGRTSTATVIVDAVTPGAVAPPFARPTLHSRTHGGRYRDAYRNRPVSESHDGFASADLCPIPLETTSPADAARATPPDMSPVAAVAHTRNAVVTARRAKGVNTVRSVAHRVRRRWRGSARWRAAGLAVTPGAIQTTGRVRLSPRPRSGRWANVDGNVNPSPASSSQGVT